MKLYVMKLKETASLDFHYKYIIVKDNKTRVWNGDDLKDLIIEKGFYCLTEDLRTLSKYDIKYCIERNSIFTSVRKDILNNLLKICPEEFL